MNKSKFEILLDKSSHLVLEIFHGTSRIKTGILTGIATFFIIMSTIAIGGFFSSGLIAIDKHRIDNYRNKSRYCSDTIKEYIKENIVEICEPLINNLNNQDNVRTTE